MSTRDDSPDTRQLHILLAEDSPLHQRHAVWLLETAGHRVSVVSNGREALDALPNDQFDVVLMDVEMPVIDGLTATRMLREQEVSDGPRMPVVAVTSSESRESCLRAGMDAFLAKPLDPELLKATLADLLQRSAA